MSENNRGQSEPLPVTAELGGEGGSWGDAASRESRENSADGPERVRESVTDTMGNLARLPDEPSDADAPAVREELKKHPAE